jgi:hypothetical protein
MAIPVVNDVIERAGIYWKWQSAPRTSTDYYNGGDNVAALQDLKRLQGTAP